MALAQQGQTQGKETLHEQQHKYLWRINFFNEKSPGRKPGEENPGSEPGGGEQVAGLKEIERRLKSVKNTKKITYAMKLVAAVKLRKAQESATRAREYTEALANLLQNVSGEKSDYSHPLLQAKEKVSRVRMIVVGGNRGLCGPYNSNLNKKCDEFIRTHSDYEIDAVLLGRKPAEHFRRRGHTINSSYEELPESPALWPIQEVCQKLEIDFLKNGIDEVYLFYTKFYSAMSMSVECQKLLPFDTSDTLISSDQSSKAEPSSASALFEPSPEEVFQALIPRIVRSQVLQAAFDAQASEQGSRMTAMDAATSNASDLIDSLKLTHNKLRQAGITAELLDIIGGAEAIA